MKDLQKKMQDDVAKLELVEMIMDLQKYPLNEEKYLMLISEESQKYGILWAITRAYLFGLIIGKRVERKKKRKL